MPAKKKTPDTEVPDFESTIKQLDTLVQTLEKSDISLEESLQAFEQGMSLTSTAQKALASAEQRVRLLIEKNGEVVSDTFSPDEDEQ